MFVREHVTVNIYYRRERIVRKETGIESAEGRIESVGR